jgi:diacylglycerol O-acyltransferase
MARLSGHDQAFLMDTAQPAVGALVMLGQRDSERLSRAGFESLLADRLDLLPRHRQIPWPVAGGAPRWVDDPAFDLRRHIGVRAAIAAVDELHRAPFPAGRPPWDATLLEDGHAVYLRWHHGMVDGMSAIAVGRVLFDREPFPPRRNPPPWHPEPISQDDLIAETAREQLSAASQMAWDRAARWLDPLAKLESDVAFLDGWLDLHDRVAVGAPRTAGTSRLTLVDTRPHDELAVLARSFPGKLEGVVVTMLAAAVARLASARGESWDRPLRVLVPVAKARRNRQETLGNAAAFYLLDVPLGLPLGATAQAVDEQIRRVKELHTETVTRMIEWLDLLPAGLVAILSQTAARTEGIDAIVSYVRGPRTPLWLSGYEHLGTYSTLPTSAAVPLAFGVVGLGGRVTFSLAGADGVYPELEFLAGGLRATFDQMLAHIGH